MNDMLFPVIGEEGELPFYGFYLHQIHIFTEGEGELSICGNTYKVTNQMTAFLPANIPHEYHKTSGSRSYSWISFDGKYPDIFLERVGKTKASVRPKIDRCFFIRKKEIKTYDKLIIISC